VKPTINSVEGHPKLGNDKHPVDGVSLHWALQLAGLDARWVAVNWVCYQLPLSDQEENGRVGMGRGVVGNERRWSLWPPSPLLLLLYTHGSYVMTPLKTTNHTQIVGKLIMFAS
jgi:hypothetical protein